MVRVRYRESRIDQIGRDGKLPDYAVVLKSVASHALLATHEPATTLAAFRAMAEEVRRVTLARFGKNALGHFIVVQHSDLWDGDHLDVELGFLLNQSGGRRAGAHQRPEFARPAASSH
jgi:hypothetical protein